MSKAEERALERFPVHEGASEKWIEMHLKGVCAEYIEGYNQAEKDLELTLEDVEKIVDLYEDVYCDFSIDGKGGYTNTKEHYQEVLKRFKAKKNE